MSKPEIEKVPSSDERQLPIFAEIDDLMSQVRLRAFNLFKRRGFTEGHELEDWLTAEREMQWPDAELIEEDDKFEIHVALAGFEPEDVSVTATPREIIVKASHNREQSDDKEQNNTKVHWSQISSSEVYRRIEVPADINVDSVEAEMKRGMLEIEADKAVEKKRKRKQVRVAKGK